MSGGGVGSVAPQHPNHLGDQHGCLQGLCDRAVKHRAWPLGDVGRKGDPTASGAGRTRPCGRAASQAQSVELTLQEEYLEIEHQRFSDRMSFHIDMPEDVRGALVPSLILQPLIENAIKHGVGAMAGRVSIWLSAKREADRLRVIVENSMPVEMVGPKPTGMGVGLKNVAGRLRARFKSDCEFSAGPAEPGIYRAALDLPWRTE